MEPSGEIFDPFDKAELIEQNPLAIDAVDAICALIFAYDQLESITSRKMAKERVRNQKIDWQMRLVTLDPENNEELEVTLIEAITLLKKIAPLITPDEQENEQ